LLEGQKPSKRVVLWGSIGLDNCSKISSQYSTYNIFISYAELCTMPTFQNSMYLDSPKFINFTLSIDFDATLLQIGYYRTKLGTLVGNFGESSKLTFHNLLKGPSIKLQTWFVGENLYYIIGQLDKSTKNLNICILVCTTNVLGPSFKQPRT